jgi:hypothetical protein
MAIRILAAAALLLIGAPAHAQQRPAARVAQGRLAGVSESGLNIFRGIP